MYGTHRLPIILFLHFVTFVLSQFCIITQDGDKVTSDCSNHNLIGVPTGVLRNTTHLLLNNNRIKSLPAGVFQAMAGLVHLDLSNNLISGFNQDTFTGLHNLTYLNLDFNKMCMDYAAYPAGLFRDTMKLKMLKLYGRPDCRHKYPEETIKSLNYLEDITLPFAKIPVFGEGFGLLKSLKRLTISKEKCDIQMLDGSVFQTLSEIPIKELSITNCYINGSHLDAFSHFKNLKTLNLACNSKIQLSDAMKVIKNIPSKLDTLILDSLHYFDRLTEITKDMFCLDSLKNLKRLSIRDLPGTIDVRVFLCLEKVEQLVVGYNTFFLQSLHTTKSIPQCF